MANAAQANTQQPASTMGMLRQRDLLLCSEGMLLKQIAANLKVSAIWHWAIIK
jgi:hypothetical protein